MQGNEFGERVDNNGERYQPFGESLQFIMVCKALVEFVDVKLRFHDYVYLVAIRVVLVSYVCPLLECGSCVWRLRANGTLGNWDPCKDVI